MTLLQKPIKHDTCAVRQCGEVTKEHKGNALLATVVYFVSFVFEDLFAVDSNNAILPLVARSFLW
jgi:hypothetical protein